MGITCEISLSRPPDGKYVYQPGSIVSGAIRYYLHEEYEFNAITVSLKGVGKLYFEDRVAKRRNRMYKHSNEETYVDIDNIIHKKNTAGPLPAGQYETPFSFQLPFDIPASLNYLKVTNNYNALCNILYYVRIKFERPGFFTFDKRYKKEIKVISGQVPRMTTAPLIYGDQKKLIQLGSLFSSKKGIVNLKATIPNSVHKPGETVQIGFEIENDTNIDLKKVTVRLLEVDKYTSLADFVAKVHSEVEGTKCKYDPVQGGNTAKFTAEIVIPELCASIDHSKIIARDYCIMTDAALPMPHTDMTLEIPIQVIEKLSSTFRDCTASTSTSAGPPHDAPPTYWEAMGEEKKETLEFEVQDPVPEYEEFENKEKK